MYLNWGESKPHRVWHVLERLHAVGGDRVCNVVLICAPVDEASRPKLGVESRAVGHVERICVAPSVTAAHQVLRLKAPGEVDG